MLSFLGKLFGALPIQWQIGLLVGGALALAGICGTLAFQLDQGGYRRATLEWTVKYEQRERELEAQRLKELDRQATVNAAAKAAEQARIAELQRRVADLDLLANELLTEAAADPNADRIGLDAEAVDRITRGTR